jgi:hypothetical protein
MTSGSIVEMVGLPKSVGGFHSVWAYSGVFLVMRWTILEKVLGSLPCGPGFPWRPSFLEWGADVGGKFLLLHCPSLMSSS